MARPAQRSVARHLLVRSGPAAMNELAAPLDDLLEAARAPITARRPWLSAWVAHTPAFTPWVVGIGSPTHLEAVALLATRRIGPLVSVCQVGRGPSDYHVLPARDGAAAHDLADAIAHVLHGLRCPWILRLEQLPEGDPVVAALRDRLPAARTTPGAGAPTVRFTGGRDVADYLSVNGRKAVRKGRGRLAGQGLAWDVTALADEALIRGELDGLADLRRRRDLDARGYSSFDTPREVAMWRDVILAHARRGQVRVLVARVEAAVAAYAVAFTDRSAVRIWDLRYNPEQARFNPGRLLGERLLRDALADPDTTELDWMNGEESYKFSMANEVVRREGLRAASSALVARLDEAVTARRVA